MKMVTIYVDEDEWASVQKSALDLSSICGKRVSNGEFLMGLYRANLGYSEVVKPAQLVKDGSHKGIEVDLLDETDVVQMIDYIECPDCGGELLSGDKCECQKPKPKNKTRAETIARGKVNLGKSDPVSEMAADLARVVEEKVTASDKDIFFRPMPKLGKKAKK